MKHENNHLIAWINCDCHFDKLENLNSFFVDMVKLFYLGVLFKRDDDTVRCLKSAQNLQSFGFFQRNRYC